MEGLIPMVFRAIKRKKTRRQYRCLSTGGAQTYDHDDFFDIDHDKILQKYDTPFSRMGSTGFGHEKRRNDGHRRYQSYGGGFTNGGGAGGGGGYLSPGHGYDREVNGATFSVKPADNQNSKQIVRFKSRRRFYFLGSY